MFYIFRELELGEFIVVGGDCSQGGEDYGVVQFLSKTKLDVPIMYRSRGVAAQMTAALVPALNFVYDKTGVKPVIALERNNGGASEMERLSVLNREQKYTVYQMRQMGIVDADVTPKLGFDNNTATRPVILGNLKDAVDAQAIGIYDETTITEMYSFVIRNGKPQAEQGAHDDTIFALGIAWQLYQTEDAPSHVLPMEFPVDTDMFKGGFY